MPILEQFQHDNFRVLVMPKAIGETLINTRDRFNVSIRFIAIVMFRTATALAALHRNNILHGDIKPANIVIENSDSEDPVPKIIDFGHAVKLEDNESCHCHLMTCVYSSPELLNNQPHSYPSDVFSYGLTFYYLVTQNNLLHLKEIAEMYQEAMKIKPDYSDPLWSKYPDLKDLIQKTIEFDPKKRITAEEIMEHPFFEKVLGWDWINNERKSIYSKSNVFLDIEEKEFDDCLGV
ncbi:Pkinase-domain-containing protein [Histomonas meleagridis]|uniref:Pkinase-domain-containing protein n=1 Tax=Histomonas meleagridis TaxID=135588 RepID=UPI003559A60A|nr:Pkinase-domain-containing protein [Histomonas meleagridis]KAH0799850.1 Pkinase-domain-containing protein [Histomonas meleagridis]